MGKKQPVEERFWLYVNKSENGCWEWTALCDGGYGRIRSGDKMIGSHRLSYEMHHPLTKPIDEIELFVMHSCDNPRCVNPSHLSLGTNQDNMTDMVNKGRKVGISRPGEKHPNAKLTEKEVLEIRTRYTGIWGQQKQLATEYGVNFKTISDIIRNRKWTHLPPLPL